MTGPKDCMERSGLDIVNQIDITANGLITLFSDLFSRFTGVKRRPNDSGPNGCYPFAKGVIKYDYFYETLPF